MAFFKQVEGAGAVLIVNGVYTQVDVYSRDGFLFAKSGGGFVRLMSDGSTSKAKMRLDFLSVQDDELFATATGKLCFKDAAGAKLLPKERTQQLLIGGAS